MISSSNPYTPTQPIDFGLVPHRQSNVALDYRDYDVEIVKLIDPSFSLCEETLTDLDPTRPFPEPNITHTLGLRRTFTENEKADIWSKLQLLESSSQYNKTTQLQIYKDKAIDVGIYLYEFEYVKGSVRAIC
jgi:hypothetical protein